MEEIWKDIENYEGYQVSNYGRIRTFNKKTYTKKHGIRKWKNRILNLKISKKDKCCRVDLWKDGTHKTMLVHRLVANAFLEKQSDIKMTVNHIDGNRLNNRIDNLEWLTREDNIRDAFEKNLYTTQKNCILYDSKNNEYSFLSLSKASKFIGRSKGYISNCIKLNRKIISKDGEMFRIS